jgi:hypothetical protein
MEARMERDSIKKEEKGYKQQTRDCVIKENNQIIENDKENCSPVIDRFLLKQNQHERFLKNHGINYRTPLKNCSNDQKLSSKDDPQKRFHDNEMKLDPLGTQCKEEITFKSPTLNDNLEELLVYDSGHRSDVQVFHDRGGLQTDEILEHFGCSPIYSSKDCGDNSSSEQRNLISSIESPHPINSKLFPCSPSESDTSDLTVSDDQDGTERSGNTDESQEGNSLDNLLDDLDSIIEDAFDNIRNAIERNEEKPEVTSILPSATALLLQREQTRKLEAKVVSNMIDLDLSLSSKDTSTDCSISTETPLSISFDNSNDNILDEPLQLGTVTLADLHPRYHKYFALTTFLIGLISLWGLLKLTFWTFFAPITLPVTPYPALHHSQSQSGPYQISSSDIPEDFRHLFKDTCSINEREEFLISESHHSATSPIDFNALISSHSPQQSSPHPHRTGGVTGYQTWIKESFNLLPRRRMITLDPSRNVTPPGPLPPGGAIEILSLSNEMRKGVSQILQTRKRFMIQKKLSLESSILHKFSQLLSSLFIFLRRHWEKVRHK